MSTLDGPGTRRFSRVQHVEPFHSKGVQGVVPQLDAFRRLSELLVLLHDTDVYPALHPGLIS